MDWVKIKKVGVDLYLHNITIRAPVGANKTSENVAWKEFQPPSQKNCKSQKIHFLS